MSAVAECRCTSQERMTERGHPFPGCPYYEGPKGKVYEAPSEPSDVSVVPIARLRELVDAERERDELRAAIRRHRDRYYGLVWDRTHINRELWELLDE